MSTTPPVLAYHFWSPTCGPCKAIKPAIADLIDEFLGIYFVGVNTHDDPQGIAAKFNVSVVPTMVFLVNGVEVGRYSGTSIIMYYTLARKALSIAGK
jgi:thioredoxin-like negative regulator of GroEL